MAEVIDRDLGWKDIMHCFRRLNGKTIKAGVLEGAGSEANGASIAEVATYNEYGTRRIPSRPFIAIATDESKGWQGEIKRQVGGITSSADVNGALNTIGEQMKKDIKNVIGDRSKLKPNAPSTIAKKGFDAPLIDTGKLQEAIDYEVK
jgi:hypothetical protein